MSEIDKLLETNLSTFILDVLEKALCLPEDVLEKFIEPKRGIYLYNSTKPLLNLEDNKYYLENGGLIETLSDLKNSTGYILDNKGNVIISETRLKRITKILLDKPNTPVTAIEFIIRTIENFILRSTVSEDKILVYENKNLLKNPDDYEFVNNNVSIVLNEVFENLNDFINTDIYNIYEFDKKGNLLIIYKKQDFRIVEYYRQKDVLSNLNNK